MTAFRPLATFVLAMLLLSSAALAKDAQIRIPLPKKSKATPVQQLNRDGVKEIAHRNYERAKRLFFRAYLLDPDDPFTLNNLGYVSELQGDADAAQRYYALAAQFRSDAVIAESNIKSFVGKPVDEIAGRTEDKTIELNRINVRALALLDHGRAPEADVLLNRALRLDPQNPFTLNNLGFAKEQEGELENALGYYNRAAATGSNDKIVVAANRDWRGKQIADVAAANARKVRRLLSEEDSPEARVARLNLMGVSALNRNDRRAARTYFEQASKLDPANAFTLNNMGYVSELDGDRESATFYYAKAREAERADVPVGVATRMEAEGQPLQEVAVSNRTDVESSMQQALDRRRQSPGPVLLHERNGAPVVEPAKPVAPLNESYAEPTPETGGQPAPSQPVLTTRPGSESNIPGGMAPQPSAVQPGPAPAVQQPAPKLPVATPPPPEPERPDKVVVPYDTAPGPPK